MFLSLLTLLIDRKHRTVDELPPRRTLDVECYCNARLLMLLSVHVRCILHTANKTANLLRHLCCHRLQTWHVQFRNAVAHSTNLACTPPPPSTLCLTAPHSFGRLATYEKWPRIELPYKFTHCQHKLQANCQLRLQWNANSFINENRRSQTRSPRIANAATVGACIGIGIGFGIECGVQFPVRLMLPGRLVAWLPVAVAIDCRCVFYCLRFGGTKP